MTKPHSWQLKEGVSHSLSEAVKQAGLETVHGQWHCPKMKEGFPSHITGITWFCLLRQLKQKVIIGRAVVWTIDKADKASGT